MRPRFATADIKEATDKFASKIDSGDATGFAELWRKHQPAASVAALSLVLEEGFETLLKELYDAKASGQSVYDAVVEKRRAP